MSPSLCGSKASVKIDNSQRHIYIVGAQCTGKTTLVAALQHHFSNRDTDGEQSLRFEVVPEIARQVFGKIQLTGPDILQSSHRAMQIQETILQEQYTSEALMKDARYISDRSAVDAIVYAERYAGSAAAQKLIASKEWDVLRSRMNRSLIILCEPVRMWLEGDGFRLMPTCDEDWISFHRLFIQILGDAKLSYHILPSNLTSIRDRLDFVLQRL